MLRTLYTSRFIPEGSHAIERPELNKAVVYCFEKDEKLYAIAYQGRRNKPDFYYRYQSEASREDAIEKFFAGIASRLDYRAEVNRQRREFKSKLEVGSILYCSWGWEQTNVDFYQVVAVKSAKTVVVREIGASVEEKGFMSGEAMPMIDHFVGEPMVKRVSVHDSIRISDCQSASVWHGRPVHCSWYA